LTHNLTSKNDTFHTNIQINGVNLGICLHNNLDNFQLHSFTMRENITKSFFFWGGGYFFTRTVYGNEVLISSDEDKANALGQFFFWVHQ